MCWFTRSPGVLIKLKDQGDLIFEEKWLCKDGWVSGYGQVTAECL